MRYLGYVQINYQQTILVGEGNNFRKLIKECKDYAIAHSTIADSCAVQIRTKDGTLMSYHIRQKGWACFNKNYIY